MDATLIVLAGGQSRRMGTPKALLPVPPRNIPLLQFVLERLARHPALVRTILVVNDPDLAEGLELPVATHIIPDRIQGEGPLRGLASGLEQATGWCLATACDMPCIRLDLLVWLLACAAAESRTEPPLQAVVPQVQGKIHPLHAAYHVSCLPAVMQALYRGQRHLTSFLADIRVRYVTEEDIIPLDPQLESFRNLNTRAEWDAFLAEQA